MQFNRLWAMLAAFPGARALWRRWPVGSIETRVAYDVSSHAPYAFGVLSAARLAKALGLPGISVVEFGVAGGRGLIALERMHLQGEVHELDAGTQKKASIERCINV